MDDTRNVADKYKGWHADLIREDIRKKSFPYAVMMENWSGDFNIGTLVRNANAFGAKEVFYCGKKKWDRRGAVGTHNYTSVNYIESIQEINEDRMEDTYTLIGIDNVPGSKSITNFYWPDNPLMVFGEEGTGLTEDMQKQCRAIIEIPMYGSVRSLNCGSSSAVVMADFINKFQKKCCHVRLNREDLKTCADCHAPVDPSYYSL